jgi:hypothetical protein
LAQSRHPQIQAYLDQQLFSTFKLAYGELVWGDYALCFPVMDIYRNTLQHAETLPEAA